VNYLEIMQANGLIKVENLNVKVGGRFLKTACLNDEYYVPIADPAAFILKLKAAGVKADLFTFVQELHDRTPKHGFALHWDELAVLTLTTYEHWWKKQIKDKTRNMVRRAQKMDVELRVAPFDDDLIRSIKSIYDETPFRQGKRNWHYQKDLATLRREHATFLDRSEFIGAYCRGELIGFAKVTHAPQYSILMNIVAKVAARDKAPTNALIAKTIELVAARNIALLNYGVWGRRGLNDFKTSSAFECCRVPRYYVPLTPKGRLALALKLHRDVKEHLPESWIAQLSEWRMQWNKRKYSTAPAKPALETGSPSAAKSVQGEA
jgi:hypothetical protein